MTSAMIRLVMATLWSLVAAAPPAMAQDRPAALAPAELTRRIGTLGASFDGKVGIAVQAVEQGWQTGWKDKELYPQQSVSKFFVALTAMDAVDRGRLTLDGPVTLTRDDLTVFNQPIAQRVLSGGTYQTTVEALLIDAITKSDNTANDKLMRVAGGPAAVRRFIADRKLGAIRFYEGERALQSRIAGLTWSQSYSIGDAFYKARDALPMAVRKSLFERYISDPYDGAAPAAIVGTLARLKRGELLSPASTARLLTIMSDTRTGKNRLRGGLKPGWTLAHKTGTGQILNGVQAGYNDIGVLTAPDGRSYAVAVMIKRTATPLIVRMNLMNEVVRAVIAAHEARQGGLALQ
ncbi:class A beta-lactamase [Sphingomonas astaxanthinifaciens]|uniref:beta-lactamase n=1 Tax=Sphingomonas astaxanthinifaciens DSM 22298 TaxID=1123267 RepID=A0ABQ5Z1T5_9SPHN|nr:class A beta-lactamase [Sphingomonas astaxanthinifaciens]GLR46718.1 beta-lactamase [Sphingomonas astaxanthinifaciens DSM 22298]